MTQASIHDQLGGYIARQRWFGGKGRDFTVGAPRPLGLGMYVVEVAYADAGAELYQVPLSSYETAQPHLDHALVGRWDGQWHYDAVHDQVATRAWLAALARIRGDGDVVVRRVADQAVADDLASTLFSGEQSNSSLAFGDDSMLKVFRRITPGVNPDIEIHEALTRSGSTHVARLLGWFEAGDLQLGLLQEFLRDAHDGWGLALDSVRDGEDFTVDSHRLGVATAEVHATLRQVLPVATIAGSQVASRMQARLDEATVLAPGLAEDGAAIRAAQQSMAETRIPAQRIHADLHLGQTLRTAEGWKLVDFEGEPARPLAERALPDSTWRDVAGMLRSFDYAAQVVAREGNTDPRQAADWTRANRAAFLAGYASTTADFTAADRALIRAFEIDKAVYEVSYEARNRPGWIDIPLNAISRILEDEA